MKLRTFPLETEPQRKFYEKNGKVLLHATYEDNQKEFWTFPENVRNIKAENYSTWENLRFSNDICSGCGHVSV